MEACDATRAYYMVNYFSKWYPASSYNVSEAAKLLRVKPETVVSYIAAGELPAEKLGSSYRISVEDLKDFLLMQSKGLMLRRERRCTV